MQVFVVIHSALAEHVELTTIHMHVQGYVSFHLEGPGCLCTYSTPHIPVVY